VNEKAERLAQQLNAAKIRLGELPNTTLATLESLEVVATRVTLPISAPIVAKIRGGSWRDEDELLEW
jgi:hypothetical protein